MTAQRKKHIQEMNRLEQAINKTSSPYLKRDYKKALKRMRKELIIYDAYHEKGD